MARVGMKKMGVPARVRSGELGAGAAVCLPVLAVGRCAKCGKHEWAPRFSNREQRPYSRSPPAIAWSSNVEAEAEAARVRLVTFAPS
jgi:hypothetical protein